MKLDETRIAYEYLSATRTKGVMLDVGAHIGGSALPFLANGWRVCAFEPNDENREKLTRLAEQYPLLSVDPRAVSDKSGQKAPFYASHVSTGIGSLSPFHSSHALSSHVDTVTLVDFCREKQISKVDFLKIDTEGHDFFVLKGFPWDTLQPDIIECEFEDRKTSMLGYSFGEMADFLTTRGYEVLVSEWDPIVEYGGNHQWHAFKAWPCTLEKAESWGNLLAFRGGLNRERLCNAIAQTLGRDVERVSQKKAPASTPQRNRDEMMRAYLRLRWRGLRAEGVHSVYLFGAGKFTKWFMPLIHDAQGPSIIGVLDDQAVCGQTIGSTPVLRPDKVDVGLTDGVILSTDSLRNVFTERCRSLYGMDVRLIDLFEDLGGESPKTVKGE
ncbi:MAG: hypothetical protein A2X46_15945 [Lentisphaerae bacterium GWF2_57_35]|nr:MAG: hypothetical protein A2X46_15945 [Lentisphaerae bacterium GWF2_57_35]